MPKQPAAAVVPADPRKSLEEVAEANRPPAERELTSAERSAQFATDVKARMASPSSKIAGVPASVRYLQPGRLQPASAKYRTMVVDLEHGHTIEDLMSPHYWTHVAKQLNVWDQIIIRWEDGSCYAEAIVAESGQQFVKLAMKPGYPLKTEVSEPDVDASIPSGYEIKWRGPHLAYAVLRNDLPLRDGFKSKGAAAAWLRNHLTVIGR